MHGLRALLAVNGVVFVLRALINVVRPTAFYLEPEAPTYARDAVRVLGITYAALGAIQLGMSALSSRWAVRVAAGGSMLFAAGVAAQAALQDSASSDAFHRLRLGSAAENGLVAALYAALLFRDGSADGEPNG
jgi:hypothetical protein